MTFLVNNPQVTHECGEGSLFQTTHNSEILYTQMLTFGDSLSY